MNQPPIAEFVYVDAAFGGVDHRNNIRKITSVVVNGLTDCYVSHNRATDALVSWVKEHRNKKGNPTVEGFDGETWADNLHLDFDAADDPARALGWLLTVLLWLEAVGVDLRAVRIYFSGAKGFHLEIPHTHFGGFVPAKDLPKRLRRAAKLILGEIPFDTSVYDTLRLWRLENSRNSKTGLYKIRLTIGEVRTLTLDAIRTLASCPRDTSVVPELAPLPDDEWLPNGELVGIWEETVIEDEVSEPGEWRAPTDVARDAQTAAAIAASWPRDGKNTVEGEDGKGQVSRHGDYLLAIGGFLARRTNADHVAELLVAGAEHAGDQTFLTGRDWRSEITRIANGAAERILKDEKVKGLPSVAKHFPGLAIVLDVLWPGPTVNFDWEDDEASQERSEPGTGDGPVSAPASTASSVRGDAPWPQPIAEEAYHGWLGDAVRLLAPTTEADPAAIFAHLIVGTGIVLGPETRAMVGNAPHPPKHNAVVVGSTAHGRKGTAQRASEGLVTLADTSFRRRIVEGLSSGEGLIWQVRDPITKFERPKGGGEPEEVVVDPGVNDKRLLVIESEFASVLRVAQREGNTLTAIIRRAWDRDDLQTLTKNNPATATGAHIGIVGHVSREEFLRYLDRSELANGFANRFGFYAARRSRLLPDGDSIPTEALAPLSARLRVAQDWAAEARVLQRDGQARAIWHEVYGSLTAERAGMFGNATTRAEAQTLRLSVQYAILDCSELIRAEHLLAALAIWRYCEQSARWVFGDATGDPTADTILGALRRSGELDREDIVNLFGRHANRPRIDRALNLLLGAGLARVDRQATGGRPREVWRTV